jgi:signal transduction histidine kinase
VSPFASIQLPRIDAFIPSFEALMFVTDLITSVLLFSQFWIYQSRALLALACGYLFTALIIIPHALTFPGAFSKTGLLNAGLQTTAWLYWFWHFALPLALLLYAWLKNEKHSQRVGQTSPLIAVAASVSFVFALVCGLTWITTAGDEFMPRLFQDSVHINPLNHRVGEATLLICAIALAVLWFRRSSVLDQWLMVVALAAISELVLAVTLVSGRFSLGFYAGRMFSLVTSTTVLIVLLVETARLYSRVAHTNLMLQRERKNKLMNLEAVVASISHEVKQPLAAISASGAALLRFLNWTPPNLEEARSAANGIIAANHSVVEVLDSIRALFGRSETAQEPVDLNKLALGVLGTLDTEFKIHRIAVRAETTVELPIVLGHKGQLEEVLINLVRNAVEAMGSVNDDRRVLQVRTQSDADSVIVAVEDSGSGIDPEKSSTIFDAFVTTKRHGTGLGLAISRMIVERHGGQLLAFPANPRGAIFQVVLPFRKH